MKINYFLLKCGQKISWVVLMHHYPAIADWKIGTGTAAGEGRSRNTGGGATPVFCPGKKQIGGVIV